VAIDTKTKRLSMMNFGSHAATLPEPSGGFDASDRSHLLDLYLAGAVSVTSTIAGLEWAAGENVPLHWSAGENVPIHWSAGENVPIHWASKDE